MVSGLSQRAEDLREICETRRREVAILKLKVVAFSRFRRAVEADRDTISRGISTLKEELGTSTSLLAQLQGEGGSLIADPGKMHVFNVKFLERNIRETEAELDTLSRSLQDARSARREYSTAIENLRGNVRVIVRIRPLLSGDIEYLRRYVLAERRDSGGTMAPRGESRRQPSDVELAAGIIGEHYRIPDNRTIVLSLPVPRGGPGGQGAQTTPTSYKFSFYRVLGPQATQGDVFRDVDFLLDGIRDGRNLCILTYGQTSSGKTFTLIGDDADSSDGPAARPVLDRGAAAKVEPPDPYERLGLLPRAVVRIFNILGPEIDSGTCRLSCAMLELYLDNIVDLFDPLPAERRPTSTQVPTKQLRQTEDGGFAVQGLVYKEARDAEEMITLLSKGLERRHIASTRLNVLSSRSHTVFFIVLESQTPRGLRKSTLTFADLAGSERVAKSQSSGVRFQEAQHINSSLAALGDVVSALSIGRKFIPYRNNKLTMLLKTSLGSDCKTLLFANVSPHPDMLHESLSTLTFASRVKMVQNPSQRSVVEAFRHVEPEV